MDGDMMMKILTMVGLVGYLRYKDKDIMVMKIMTMVDLVGGYLT